MKHLCVESALGPIIVIVFIGIYGTQSALHPIVIRVLLKSDLRFNYLCVNGRSLRRKEVPRYCEFPRYCDCRINCLGAQRSSLNCEDNGVPITLCEFETHLIRRYNKITNVMFRTHTGHTLTWKIKTSLCKFRLW